MGSDWLTQTVGVVLALAVLGVFIHLFIKSSSTKNKV